MDKKTSKSLTRAALCGEYDTFLGLIPEDINSKDKHGYNSLHLFIAHARDPARKTVQIDILKKLIAWKADVNIQAINKRTSLFEAIIRKDTGIITFLLECKADIRAQCEFTYTPIQLVCSTEQDSKTVPISRLFLARGAKLEEFMIIHPVNPKHNLSPTAPMVELSRKIQSILTLLGSAKRSHLLKLAGKDIITYIARLVWKTTDKFVSI